MIPKVLGLVEEFDWGLIEENQWFKNGLIREIDIEDQYQKYFKVEEGDVVLDLGASVGPFAVHILGAAPSKIICVEPHNDLFKTLVKNTARSTIVTCINKGIAGVNEEVETSNLFDPSVGVESNKVFKMNGIRFNTLVEDIQDIDFLKIDIEGGEYDVFTEDNLAWIAVHVKKIAGELHLHTPEQKEKFRRFRDLYFKAFPNFQVHANNGANIKFQIWDDNFADLYGFINFYIDNRPNRWSVTPWASLEITTILPKSGCPIDCLYCPQDALQVYDDPVRVLTVEDFKKLIDKVPKEIIISFAGFTEPFLNGGCADMIIYAHEQGHKISLFTTAIGMSMDDFFKIRHIPFGSAQGGFVLHLPDVEGYSKHVITPAYMNLLSQIMTSGMAYQAISMGTPPENIRAMFPEYTKQAMWWRAGNLNVTGTYNKADIKSGLTTCGCQEKVYHNVLLPNGDISLCCMDYGLKHILGNLHKQEYNDIIPVYNEAFELCKYCENGVLV
jgi:FkbM family methyltransferase